MNINVLEHSSPKLEMETMQTSKGFVTTGRKTWEAMTIRTDSADEVNKQLMKQYDCVQKDGVKKEDYAFDLKAGEWSIYGAILVSATYDEDANVSVVIRFDNAVQGKGEVI